MSGFRYRLVIEYDGGPYVGWQKQTAGTSIQSVFERAASRLSGGIPIAVIGAGRTDAGVHALGQGAHVDLPRQWAEGRLRDALNAHLGRHAVAVLSAHRVGPDFHARFSAIKRHYLYRLSSRRAPHTLDRGRVWRVFGGVRIKPMQDASRHLIGHHDFSAFRDKNCQATTPMRTLDTISVEHAGAEIHIACSARSFLQRQVRSMVGTLVEIGRGRWLPDDMRDILASADRTRCGPVAPPDGLYLVSVAYPEVEKAAK